MIQISKLSVAQAPILHLQQLRIEIPTAQGILHAVRGIDLQINSGETVCLVGESGCGKSLTSLAIMGLLPPKAQRRAEVLKFRDRDLLTADEDEMSDIRGNRISMIFQEPMTSLNPVFKIGDQLCEVLLRHRSTTRKDAVGRARELLELVGISAAAERLEQYPHQLSGGLRQRVMIAMALMCEPDLLIADEPTTALDVTVQAQILRLLKNLQVRLGISMLFISHDLGVVATMADRVAVMYAGQIVEEGAAASLFSRPAHPYTRGLLRCVPVPGRTARGAPLGVIPGIVPNLIGGVKGCGFKDRCAFAHPACENDIQLVEAEAGHCFRCVLDPAAQLDAPAAAGRRAHK